jgi:hypothetical protein
MPLFVFLLNLTGVHQSWNASSASSSCRAAVAAHFALTESGLVGGAYEISPIAVHMKGVKTATTPPLSGNLLSSCSSTLGVLVPTKQPICLESIAGRSRSHKWLHFCFSFSQFTLKLAPFSLGTTRARSTSKSGFLVLHGVILQRTILIGKEGAAPKNFRILRGIVFPLSPSTSATLRVIRLVLQTVSKSASTVMLRGP